MSFKIFSKSLLKRICASTAIFFAMTFGHGTATVKFGDTSDAVHQVQTCLYAQGLFSEEINGYCGHSTVSAIKEFQEAIGLIANGICDTKTFEILRAAAYDEIDITTLMIGGASNYLKPGDSGALVEELQSTLLDKGYFSGEVDGVYNSETSAAVKSFQTDKGLIVDGLCGKSLLYMLRNSRHEEDFDGYGRTMYVEATAYSSQDPGLSLYTATGNLVTRGVVSVDPNVIPLGTRIYIPGYGEAVASDTGGAIIGNRIDIAFDTQEEAINFGRQSIIIYILDD